MKQPNNKIIENETGPDFQPIPEIKRILKSNFPDYESNPRIQRMKEKQEKIKKLFKDAVQ
jgi:hypothetical protein